MRLDRLTIRRAPGIVEPFTLDGLDAGLVVIVGPNGSGKTTTCRAVRSLLWPREQSTAGLAAEAAFATPTGPLIAECDGGSPAWRRDGARCDPPRLPPRHVAHCYTITIEELLDVGADTRLAERIAVEMAGGYDLAATLERFAVGARAGQPERRALNDARSAVAECRRRQEDLRERERTLAALATQRDEAAAARDRIATLEAARGCTRENLAAAEAALADFPAGMDRLDRNESAATELAELDTQIDEARLSRVGAETRRDERRFAGEPPTPAEIEASMQRARDLVSREQARAAAAADRGAAEERVRAAAATLGADLEQPPEIDRGVLDGLDELVATRERERADRAALEARRDALGDPPETDAAPEALAAALDALHRWSAAPTAMPPSRALLAAVVAVAVLAVAAATMVALLVHPAAWTVVAIAVGLGAWSLRLVRGPTPTDDRAACRAAFERTGVEPPSAWAPTEVGRRLDEIVSALAVARERAHRRVLHEEADRALAALDVAEAETTARRRALEGAAGIPPGAADLTLAVLGDRLVRLLDAEAERAVEERRLLDADVATASALDSINALLAAHGVPAATDAASAQALLDELGNRVRELAAAEQEIRDEEAIIAARVRRRADVLATIGLSEDDRAALDDRLGRLDAWRDEDERRRTARRDLARLEERLADEPALRASGIESIDSEIRACEERRDTHDSILGEIKEIEADIRQARTGHALEEALAGQDRAEDALRAALGATLDATAAQVLLERVRAAHETEALPATVRRASQLFARFTHGRYELAVSAGGGDAPTFDAMDTAEQRRLEPSRLSTGTRMQLMLAVRLAFAIDAEADDPLPLFLDEALGASDPARYRAAMESLLMLAAEGRQLVYLTCEPHHAQRWIDAADEAGVAARRVDLAAVRGTAPGDVEAERYREARPPQVPDPDGASPEAYAAAVGVPRFDPSRPATAMHPYYLLQDDLPLLARLLRLQLDTVGAALVMLDAAGDGATVSEAQAAALRRRAAIADAFVGQWRVGRGRPIGRPELAACRAVSENYIDGFAELAGELGGDAAALLAAVDPSSGERDPRASRFSATKVGQLESELVEGGYVDPRPVLGLGDVIARVARDRRGLDDERGIEEIDRICRTLWAACGADGSITEPKPSTSITR